MVELSKGGIMLASISILESRIKRLQGELKQLENQRTRATIDESDALKKISSANQAISRTKSLTTIKTRQREIDRENDKIQKAKQKQADLSSRIAKKNEDLAKATSDLSSARQKEQEKRLKEQNKIFEDQERRLRQYELQQESLLKDATEAPTLTDRVEPLKEYDVFISHSADDKDDYVEELVRQLKEAGVKTWYDSDDIGWGKSIRESIDEGLACSKYGIVILSPSFIEKYWTNYELNGILTKQSSTGQNVILPIWHNVTADDIKKKSYSLSDLRALNTALITTEEVVKRVQSLIK